MPKPRMASSGNAALIVVLSMAVTNVVCYLMSMVLWCDWKIILQKVH